MGQCDVDHDKTDARDGDKIFLSFANLRLLKKRKILSDISQSSINRRNEKKVKAVVRMLEIVRIETCAKVMTSRRVIG